jgi:hypothetical protein
VNSASAVSNVQSAAGVRSLPLSSRTYQSSQFSGPLWQAQQPPLQLPAPLCAQTMCGWPVSRGRWSQPGRGALQGRQDERCSPQPMTGKRMPPPLLRKPCGAEGCFAEPCLRVRCPFEAKADGLLGRPSFGPVLALLKKRLPSRIWCDRLGKPQRPAP